MADSSINGRQTFEEAVAEHLDALYRAALLLTAGHADDAEDLLHDALVRSLNYWETLRDPNGARAWLFRVLNRTHINRRRTRVRRREIAIEDLGESAFESALAQWQNHFTPEALAHIAHELETAEQILYTLPEAWRVVFWLSDVEGFKQHEVADMLGIPEGTVASRLYRARVQLAKRLTDIKHRRWE